eukprot:5700782-Pleurochrysis_carterae.AAC.2
MSRALEALQLSHRRGVPHFGPSPTDVVHKRPTAECHMCQKPCRLASFTCNDCEYQKRKAIGPPPPDRFEISAVLWVESWAMQLRAASSKKDARMLQLNSTPMPLQVLMSLDEFLVRKFGRVRVG